MRQRQKDKIIVGTEVLLLCMIVGILRIHATSGNPSSSEVNYNKNSQESVQGSINDLYSKVAYGDAKANEILSGKKALVGGKEVIGTFICPTLASLTPGDATPEDVIEGKIAWVNGTRVVGVKRLLAEQVELGDYISYASKRTSYYGGMTPRSSSLFINPSKLNLWRVIRKNEDGTVDIVSNSLSFESVKIGGTASSNEMSAYKYYIWILNDLASAFETKGITVGSRHMGYDSKYAVEILSNIPSYRPDGYLTDLGTPDDGYETDTELVNAVYGNLDAFRAGTSTEGSYYLASRYNAFSGRQVSNCGNVKSPGYKSLTGALYSCVGNAYGESNGGIRPIVVLKSTLKITGGNGTVSSPYTLGV